MFGPHIESVIDVFNPLKHVSEQQYADFWTRMFATALYGFWGRFFTVTFMCLGFYFIIRRQQYMVGACFIFLSACALYGGTLLRAIGIV